MTDTCPICYAKMYDCIMTTCDHLFCKKCLLKWCCDYASTCPLCRCRIHRISTVVENEWYFHPFTEFGVIIELNEKKEVFIDEIICGSQADSLQIQRSIIKLIDGIHFTDLNDVSHYVNHKRQHKRACLIQTTKMH